MIVKHRQPVPGLRKFARRNRFVMAKRVMQDFIAERGTGWLRGQSGDWLVQVEDDLWEIIANDQFTRIFREVTSDEPSCYLCDQACKRKVKDGPA